MQFVYRLFNSESVLLYLSRGKQHKDNNTSKKEADMKEYKVIIAGTVDSTHTTREEAEKRLNEIKHSFLAIVHPIDCMFIKEVDKIK